MNPYRRPVRNRTLSSSSQTEPGTAMNRRKEHSMRTKTLDLDFPTLDKLQSEKAPATRTIKKIDPVVRTVPKIRVASYARISTDHDDQKESIVIQRQHFNSLAKRQHDWIYVGCYWDVMSGTKKDKRPGLQRLLADCRAGRVNLILTKSISRREYRHWDDGQ